MTQAIKPMNKTFVAGKWMPSDHETLTFWLKKILSKSDLNETNNIELLPSVQALKDFIESDAKAYMFFTQMFDQVPQDKTLSPENLPQVRDYHQMLQAINVIIVHAPEFDENGLVGCPLNAIFNWSMATEGGWAAFLNDDVNFHLKNILNEWGKFLKSSESVNVLNDDPKTGWFGADAKKAMPNFVEEFVCDPTAPFYGYQSWDHFFTREFKDGVRPIASPDDPNVIINACESAPYRIAKNVQLLDTFWLKARPYALKFMMDNDPFVSHFVGGTVYQAYLSALSYHRWHAPVSGRIVKTRIIEGTYFSESLIAGYDPAAPDISQSYIAEVATRGLIFIEADNPKIGLMCFMAIGMAEISTCDITVYEGQHVTKGDELGMFHYGGSTHCLFFSPDVDLEFNLNGQTPSLDSHNIPINSCIATVK